jgi:RNA polymerase sigma factor (sigma-70 family)
MSSGTRPTLLDRLREGADTLAWDEFFQRYWRLMYAWARRRGCSDDTAEEIVQEVMLAVFERRDVYRYDPQRGRFRDWLGTLVRNKVVDHRRRPSGRVRGRGGDPEAGFAEPEAADLAPDAAWETAFEETLLVVLLDLIQREMNPRTYQAFELFTLHEVPAAKVAETTGLTPNAVYQARKNVLRRLRELGGAYREEGQLDERVKRALLARPAARIERSLTARIAKTMRSR